MCLCSTFTCCISPLQAGSSKQDRNSRTKCEGKGTRGVDVHSTICARGNVLFAVLVGAFDGRAQHEAVWERGCSKGRKLRARVCCLGARALGAWLPLACCSMTAVIYMSINVRDVP